MTTLELDSSVPRKGRSAVTTEDLDVALTAQFAVAWAGEGGEEKRLAWWRSDLISEFGGEDLFRRLLPSTWEWAVLQGAREAARRKDAELRGKDHNPDRILSLYSLGFELDERIDERLQDLKRAGQPPKEALPALGELMAQHPWKPERFLDWVTSHGEVETTVTPTGRAIAGEPPQALGDMIPKLVAGLAPLAESYPLPHFRRAPRK